MFLDHTVLYIKKRKRKTNPRVVCVFLARPLCVSLPAQCVWCWLGVTSGAGSSLQATRLPQLISSQRSLARTSSYIVVFSLLLPSLVEYAFCTLMVQPAADPHCAPDSPLEIPFVPSITWNQTPDPSPGHWVPWTGSQPASPAPHPGLIVVYYYSAFSLLLLSKNVFLAQLSAEV